MTTKMLRRHRKPWCARIAGFYPSGRPRYDFLDGHVDWAQSNGVGSRGVRLVFYPECGHAYRAHYFVSWSRTRDDWFTVTGDGELSYMDEREALEWSRDHMCGVVPMGESEGVWTHGSTV